MGHVSQTTDQSLAGLHGSLQIPPHVTEEETEFEGREIVGDVSGRAAARSQLPLTQTGSFKTVHGYHSHPETRPSEKKHLLGNERTPPSTGQCRWWDLLFPVLPGFSLLFLFLSYSQPLGPLFPDTSSPSSPIHLQLPSLYTKASFLHEQGC